jgi:molecular chaperone Hsp33
VPVEKLVAEAALLTALIGQTIKLRWKLSLQVRGDGPARLIATDYFAPARAGRAGAHPRLCQLRRRAAGPRGRPFGQIGRGYFAILIDQGRGMTPYQGITPIAGRRSPPAPRPISPSPSSCRPASRWATGRPTGRHWRAGGRDAAAHAQGLAHVSGGGSGEGGLLPPPTCWTATPGELAPGQPAARHGGEDRADRADVQATELLVRLFHEEGPRVFDAQPVQFGCTCSHDKVRQSLSIYSAKDIRT